MNPTLTLTLLLALTTTALCSGYHQSQIALRIEYYETDLQTANTLITTPTDRTDATQIRNHLRKNARLVDSSYVVTRSGQRAKVESVTEWIYPTEFDPPEGPQNLTGPVTSANDILTPITSTAYETRNLGHTFEVDPVIGPDGVTLDINLAPELVSRLGDHTLGQRDATLQQPVFHLIKNSTAITMHSGNWALLGIHSPPPPATNAEPPTDRRILALLKAEVIEAGSQKTAAAQALRWADWNLKEWALYPEEDEHINYINGLSQRLKKRYGDHIPSDIATQLREKYDKLRAYIKKTPPKSSDTEPAPDPFADPGTEVPQDPFADPGSPPPAKSGGFTQIAIHHHWYQLDANTATKLLDKHAGPFSDATPILTELKRLVAKKRATLVDSAYVVTRSGLRAKSESVREWIYPTEMDPPEIAQELTGPIDPGAQIKTHLSYTAFETRNVGTTLEVDPVINPDGVTIDINLSPEIVRLATTRHIGQKESRVEQPVFHTIKDSTAVTLHSGTAVLLGMHTPMPDDVTALNLGSHQRILSITSARIIKAN